MGKILRIPSENTFDKKEDSMKRLSLPILAVFSVLIAGLFLFSDAAAEDLTCKFKADSGDVHVFAWDEDDERERMDSVFEGWIKAGQEIQISSKTGLITYNFRKRTADRTYGDNHATCKNGNTIRVP
jgi:hypothetical protein